MTLAVSLVAASIALFAYGALSVAFGDDRLVSRRLTGLSEYELSQVREAQPVLKSFQERVLVPLGAFVSDLLRHVWPKDYWMNLSKKVTVAGRPAGMGPEAFLAIKIASGALVLSLVALVLLFSDLSMGARVLVAVVSAAFGYFVPSLWLSSVTSKRSRLVLRELPDMLDMLTISVEAGLGFDAALAKYVRNSSNTLALEFGRALQEIQAGSSRKEALKRLADRVSVNQLSSFISALVQADVLGTSIANVLRVQSQEMRLTRRQHAEREAQKLPVKMVFPVILFILPATMIVVLGPAVIALMRLFST